MDMPRPLRLEFNDAWYHVMNRGSGRQLIYKNTLHRKIFLELLGEATQLFRIEIHGYCLMDNHYHLLIKTPRGNLSRAMRHINGLYTQRFNRNIKKDGPLFRGRYKAIIVDGNSYLLQVSRYIHLNPVVANINKKPEEYKWSSYQNYLKPKKRPWWLKVEDILSMLDEKKKNSSYQRFIESGIDSETRDFYVKGNTPAIFGSKNSIERLLNTLDDKKIASSSADYNRTRALPSIEDINQLCNKYFKISKGDSIKKSVRSNVNPAREIAIYGCRVWASEKLAKIAEFYGYHSHASVSNIVKKIGMRSQSDKKLERMLEKIRNKVVEIKG